MSNNDALTVFQPEIMGGAMKMADQMSRSTLIPRALHGKPGDVLVVLLTGREFGLGPMQSLRSIHVVEGKPTMAADLMVGLCLARREVCEYFNLEESTGEIATYETKRVGAKKPVRLSFTIKQAQAAGVTGKDNWKRYPDAMLRARAASALARAVYPDLLAGTYDPDELSPEGPRETAPPPESRTPTRAEAEPTPKPAEPPPEAKQRAEEFMRATVGTLPAVVAFGPHKGKPVSDLSHDELSDAIRLATDRLSAEPSAKWAKAARENVAAMEAEQSRRMEPPPESSGHREAGQER